MSTAKVSLIRLDLGNSKSIKHPYHCSPPFSLKYLEAILRDNGFEDVCLYDAMPGRYRNEEVLAALRGRRPDFVVYTVNVTTLKEFREFNARLKQECPALTVAMGSIDPRFVPPELDIYLPGEAEAETAQLIQRIATGESDPDTEVARYAKYKQGPQPNFLVHNLDDLPFPRYSREEIKDYRFIYPVRMSRKLRWGHILSSRGCPYKCTFCSPVTRESYGAKARLRSAANVVDEIERLKEQGVNMISFDDDLLTITRRHISDLCDEMIRRDVRINWLAHSRIDNIDYELLSKMKEAGCVLLRFGVESGSARIVASLTKSFKKIDWNDQAKKVFRYAKELDIATHALLIIGSPTETEAEIQETFQLVKEINPDIMQIHFFSPYPGSVSYEQLKAELSEEQVMNMFHYELPRQTMGSLNSERLGQIRSDLYRRIFLNPRFFFSHMRKYFRFYMTNLDVFYRLSKGLIYIR